MVGSAARRGASVSWRLLAYARESADNGACTGVGATARWRNRATPSTSIQIGSTTLLSAAIGSTQCVALRSMANQPSKLADEPTTSSQRREGAAARVSAMARQQKERVQEQLAQKLADEVAEVTVGRGKGRGDGLARRGRRVGVGEREVPMQARPAQQARHHGGALSTAMIKAARPTAAPLGARRRRRPSPWESAATGSSRTAPRPRDRRARAPAAAAAPRAAGRSSTSG